jgi:hypothetical protein
LRLQAERRERVRREHAGGDAVLVVISSTRSALAQHAADEPVGGARKAGAAAPGSGRARSG